MREGFEKRFNQGDIVYWCHQYGHEYSVHYGMVDEQFSDAVCIDHLSLKECRRVNGIPIDEFQSEQRDRKLPKGWSYDTKLYEITYDTIDGCSDGRIDNPDSLKLAYEKGLLVKDETIFHGVIEADITKDGYKIVKKYPQWQHHFSRSSVRPDKVYFTYKEAKKEVDDNIAEFHRQASLSEYDWSLEQIDNTLKRWQFISGETDRLKELYRNCLIGMKDVEDIETRIFGGEIQWKYWKNKKWNNIEL